MMPSVKLYTSSKTWIPTTTAAATIPPPSNPLPPLLQTPSGLAIVEIQGTIHAPFPLSDPDLEASTTSHIQLTDIGRLEFPLYDPTTTEGGSDKWTKKVYFYVGKHQRLVGEVKKLTRPMAVIRKREEAGGGSFAHEQDWEEKEKEKGEGDGEELEIAEIIRWKIIFGGRPEPVGVDGNGEGEVEKE